MISRRLLPASVLLLLLLGACSGSQGTTEEQASGPAEKDPPGVAQALSLGGQLEEDSESSAYDRAIGCAVAFRVTAVAIAPLTSGSNSREVRALEAGARAFARRARSAEGAQGRDVPEDIDAQVAESDEGDKADQARKTLACARLLE